MFYQVLAEQDVMADVSPGNKSSLNVVYDLPQN